MERILKMSSVAEKRDPQPIDWSTVPPRKPTSRGAYERKDSKFSNQKGK